jgi:hypothetical protein
LKQPKHQYCGFVTGPELVERARSLVGHPRTTKTKNQMTEETKRDLMEVASVQWAAEMRRIKKTGIQHTRAQRIALREAAKTMFSIGFGLGHWTGRKEERGQSLGGEMDAPTLPSSCLDQPKTHLPRASATMRRSNFTTPWTYQDWRFKGGV